MGAKRPLLVTLIGVIYVLLGLLLLVSEIVLAATGMAVDPEIEEIAGLSGGAVAVLGIIQIVVGAGFLKGWKLWWYLGVIFTILNLIFGRSGRDRAGHSRADHPLVPVQGQRQGVLPGLNPNGPSRGHLPLSGIRF